MNNKILGISIIILISFLSTSGCMEDGNSSDNKKPNTVYVDITGGADFTSIQDAIKNVDDGDIIYVRAGTYYEIINIDKTVNLIGENKEKTIILYNSSIAGNLKSAITISADNCVIKGFKIDCGEQNINNKGIKITSSDNLITDNIIIYGDDGINIDDGSNNNKITLNDLSYSHKGIYAYYSDYNNISKNNLSNSSDFSVYLYGSYNNTIFGNNFSNNSICIRITGSDDNSVIGNIIKNSDGGVYLCCESKNNIIFYNTFMQNKNYHATVGKTLINQWDNESVGNYWDDYIKKYQNATQENGIWQTPYMIGSESNIDRFPLVNPINI